MKFIIIWRHTYTYTHVHARHIEKEVVLKFLRIKMYSKDFSKIK